MTASAPNWPPRDCGETAVWLSARLDGECSPEQLAWLDVHLQDCARCAGEWAELERARLAFETARPLEPSDRERRALEGALAPRLLGRLGWLLLASGTLVLAGAGAAALWTAPGLPLALRAGATAAGAGILLLLIRHGWERARTRRVDPYRDVLR